MLRIDEAGNPVIVNLETLSATRVRARAPAPYTSGAVDTERPLELPKFTFGLESDKRSSAASAQGLRVAAASPASFGSTALGTSTALSFTGLNSYEQKHEADGGNQFYSEPPNPALCVGKGFVLESTNGAVRVYAADTGAPLTKPISQNQFYSYPSWIDIPTITFGPEPSYPSCIFDAQTQRWFHIVVFIDKNSTVNEYLGPNHIDIAVSTSADPTGDWMLYKVAVQNDGSEATRNHGCLDADGKPGPCVHEFSQIGTNAEGVYVATQEWSLRTRDYISANVLAFPKARLIAGDRRVRFVEFQTPAAPTTDPGNPAGLQGYTLFPAKVPVTAKPTKNVQYFLPTDPGFFFTSDGGSNGILLWELRGTRVFSRATFSASRLTLTATLLTLESRFFVPSPASQPATKGSWPLGQCYNKSRCFDQNIGPPAPQNTQQAKLRALDSRMLSTFFASGKLWGAFPTAVNLETTADTGVVWLAIDPSTRTIVKQGVLAQQHASLLIPAFAVNSKGQGALAFTLISSTDFPSAAYAPFDGDGFGSIVVAGKGKGLQDGFTGYDQPNSYWGFYAACAVDEDDNIWLASEFIDQKCSFTKWLRIPPANSTCPQYPGSPNRQFTCGCTRTKFTNWATRVTKVQMP